MNNLVTFFLDKKLLTSRFLRASPVHCAEFEELLALIFNNLLIQILLVTLSSHLAQRYELRYRIDISNGNNYSHLVQFLLPRNILRYRIADGNFAASLF